MDDNILMPNDRQNATILAALRLYQHYLTGEIKSILNDKEHSFFLDSIATKDGECTRLDVEEINDLCESINFGDVRGGSIGRYTQNPQDSEIVVVVSDGNIDQVLIGVNVPNNVRLKIRDCDFEDIDFRDTYYFKDGSTSSEVTK